MIINKASLFDQWRVILQQRLLTAQKSQDAAKAGTRVDGGHRPENRGERAAVTSQGYLAHGLAQRVSGLQADLVLLDRMDPSPRRRVALGAVFALEDESGQIIRYALLPGGDGTELDNTVVVSPTSPVGRAVMGLVVDDESDVARGAVHVEVVVVSVA